MPVANCPSCGGPINFSIGTSVVVVCDYCRSVVARTDVALQDLGKVAALVDTGSPLRRDLPGKYRGVGFRIVGRTQMRHEMGGVWDEWYAAFDDGRWGWLAEAMGKYYLTFSTAAKGLPQFEQLSLGQNVSGLVVQEMGTATLLSGEGEIPWRVEPGSTYPYADLSGADNRFATIDYSEAAPLLFLGEETDLRGLGIDIAREPARKTKVKAERLNCTKCGGALNLVAPDQAQRIICPNCGALHNIEEGDLRYLAVVKLREKPRIPLGSKGTIDGDAFVVAGWMERSVTYDEKYVWYEYLLFNPAKGFHWLIDSDHHWSFARPIPVGDVQDPAHAEGNAAPRIAYKGKTYRIYADAVATVESVVGEFYWKVAVSDQARAIDYIAPPEGMAKEISAAGSESEIAYTLARYMPVDEVEKVFGVKSLPRPTTVGMIQPYTGGGSAKRLWQTLVAALFLIAILVAIHAPHKEILSREFDFGTVPPSPDAPPPTPSAKEQTRTVFVPLMKIDGGTNLMAEGSSDVTNNWVYIAGDLYDEKSGLLESFDLPIEYYEGYDDGKWTEGSKTQKVYLSALPEGDYGLRLEAQWPSTMPAPRVRITIEEGVFRWSHFWWALGLITIPALFVGSRARVFEARRWSDAGFTPAGAAKD
jgi:hypothetical protein